MMSCYAGRVLSRSPCLLLGFWCAVLIQFRVESAGLKWEYGPGYRSALLPAPATGKTGFSPLPPQTTGIIFTNHLSDAAAGKNRILENGSGVALGDVDGDGWCDIYFCAID